MNFGQLYEMIIAEYFKDRPIEADLYSTTLRFGLIRSQTVVNYMNTGEAELAQKTHCIIDSSSPECCFIKLSPVANEYPLHPSIVDVKKVWVEDCDKNVWQVRKFCSPFNIFKVDNSHSLPRYYQLDYANKLIKLDNKSKLPGLTLKLIVARTPKVPYELPLSTDSDAIKDEKKSRESEIPLDYQHSLMYYVGTKVLSARDIDGNSNKDYEIARAEWTSTIQEVKRIFYVQQFEGSHNFLHSVSSR